MKRRSILARLRVHLIYLWRHHRLLSLGDPLLFSELMQRRKLADRDPRFPRLIDKLGAKRFAAATLGAEWVTPTWWSGDVLPDVPPFAPPFVVKSRHGCNQQRFYRAQTDDWAAIRAASASWMTRSYGGWLDEWGYRDVPRGLLIEPFVGPGLALPIDYKLFVFHGRVRVVQVHLDRERDHRWIMFDPAWRRLSAPTRDPDPSPPSSLAAMVAGAEALGRGFDFVRVDLYQVDGQPRFGEMTFYPGSGLEPFDAPGVDEALGRLWLGSERQARRRRLIPTRWSPAASTCSRTPPCSPRAPR